MNKRGRPPLSDLEISKQNYIQQLETELARAKGELSTLRSVRGKPPIELSEFLSMPAGLTMIYALHDREASAFARMAQSIAVRKHVTIRTRQLHALEPHAGAYIRLMEVHILEHHNNEHQDPTPNAQAPTLPGHGHSIHDLDSPGDA